VERVFRIRLLYTVSILALSVFASQSHLVPLLALRATSPDRGSLSKGEALA
jgi:hypothetical protein